MHRPAHALTLLVLTGCGPIVVDFEDEKPGVVGEDTDTDVAGAPDISVDPPLLDFGVVLAGESATATFTIANTGDAVLYTELAVEGEAFALERTSLALIDGESTVLDVVFSATPIGAYSGTITITSDDPDEPTLTVTLVGEVGEDADGDGFAGSADCDDADPAVNPGAAEAWYDGVDQDCSGGSDYDADGDGADADAHGGADCDDADASVGPGASEIWYDGIDQDCDGRSDDDQDGDGHASADHGGDDCDDTVAEVHPGQLEEVGNGVDDDCDGQIDESLSSIDTDGDGYAETDGDCLEGDATVHPGAEDAWYDGVDANCDGASDYDQDADGFESDAYGGADCDDLAATTHPDAAEDWYDGVDANCDGASDYDQDADGYDATAYGGADCDDTVATTNPGAVEAWYDGLDADCSGTSDYDADADGFDAAAYGGADCDDLVATTHPDAEEGWYDGVDGDCDGASDYDADADGYDADAYGGTDCDDADGGVNPGAPEAWYDGDDANCDGASDFDQDGDGHDEAWSGGTDCDDLDAAVNPDATEAWYDGVDQDCSGASDYDQDGDGFDGEAYGGADCDDLDAAVSPDATETWYDGVDQDCSGTSDDDQDGDGFVATLAGGDDCDDAAVGVHPSAAEACDGVDQDCDGVADEGVTTVYYRDADGDGYGTTSPTVAACSAPAGYAATSTDCDDGAATTHPGAPELAYDAEDNDCDALQDEMLVSGVSDWTVVGERTTDNIGSGGVYVTEDLDGDGDPELVIASGNANSSSLTDSGILAFHDIDTADTSALLSDGYYEIHGANADDRVGCSFVVWGDIDGGGVAEFVVGACQDDEDQVDDGVAYIIDVGSSTGTGYASSLEDYEVYGDSTDANNGYAAATGDFDGDGTNEMVLGAPGEDGGKGQVYVTFLADFTGWSIENDDSQFWVKGVGANDHLGYAVAMGELTGDGYDDLVACSPDDDDAGGGSGTCWIVVGNGTRDTSTSVQGSTVSSVDTAVITGGAAGDQLGKTPQSLSVGDLDGDGRDDLAVGMPGYDGYATDGGGVLVYRNGTLSGSETSATASWLVRGDGALGTAVNMTGDVTGDGVVDLLAGATTAGPSDEGVVYLFAGGAATGTWTLPASQYASWTGEWSGDAFGAAISGLRDLDGDGVLDFAVAATGNDDGATNGGKVYVLPAYP